MAGGDLDPVRRLAGTAIQPVCLVDAFGSGGRDRPGLAPQGDQQIMMAPLCDRPDRRIRVKHVSGAVGDQEKISGLSVIDKISRNALFKR